MGNVSSKFAMHVSARLAEIFRHDAKDTGLSPKDKGHGVFFFFWRRLDLNKP